MTIDGSASQLVDFDDLECQKENIEPSRQGRSAISLAKAFSVEPASAANANDAMRERFETELVGSADLDDPLEVWMKYLNWTKEAFPAGHSAHSGYVQLLERCSKQFVNSSHYANDPRYLKIWIEYARFSDDPRELFCFLARNNIGQDLATFYEEYAAFLEVNNRKGQADEVYQMGLIHGARPLNRLKRKYDEFTQRLAANPPSADEPSSPPIAAVRAALTTKFGGLTEAQQMLPPAVKPQRARMQIFTDTTEPQEPEHVGTGGWGSIGTLQSRRKENSVEVKKMFGEKLHQSGQPRASEKLEIFKDEPTVHTRPTEAAPRKSERVVCDLEAIYAQIGDEISFEEMKAQAMGLLNFEWPDLQTTQSTKSGSTVVEDSYVSVMDVDSPLKHSPEHKAMKRQAASPTINTKAAMDDILGLFSQPLKCEQSDDSSDSDSEEDEPDNTFAATQDAPWSQQGIKSTAVSEYHSDFDEDNRNAVVNVQQESEDELLPEPVNRDEADFKENMISTVNALPSVPATPQQQQHPLGRAGGFDLMTPITEDTENLHLSTLPKKSMAILVEDDDCVTDEEDTEHALQNDPLYSSPFIENPLPRQPLHQSMAPPEKPALSAQMKSRPVLGEKKPFAEKAVCHSTKAKGPIIQESICNPMDLSIREMIFSAIFPQIQTYDCCQMSPDVSYGKKFDAIEKYIRALNKKGGEATQHLEVILDFRSKYAIKKKLGEGAFAPVFLVDNISGVSGVSRSRLEAMKIERPGSAWEFYIMRQAHRRLGLSRPSQSIAMAHEYNEFSDCSFLVLDYREQGTILDLVNMNRTDAGGVDELLAIFLTVELLRTVEALHAKELMHGDLKPDNCLLRFGAVNENEWSTAYKRDGSAGWEHKGITLIDFGRGIDMKQFVSGVQFIADWKTDEQDCIEMREARPWTYQIDYHGLACIVHSMLFGKYIETVNVGSLGAGKKRYGLKNSFKRYWKQDLWEPLFDMLLNPLSHGSFPITPSLAGCRVKMEDYLEEQGNAGIGLRGMIRKVEIDLAIARKR